jgi:hypothetical protein
MIGVQTLVVTFMEPNLLLVELGDPIFKWRQVLIWKVTLLKEVSQRFALQCRGEEEPRRNEGSSVSFRAKKSRALHLYGEANCGGTWDDFYLPPILNAVETPRSPKEAIKPMPGEPIKKSIISPSPRASKSTKILELQKQ